SQYPLGREQRDAAPVQRADGDVGEAVPLGEAFDVTEERSAVVPELSADSELVPCRIVPWAPTMTNSPLLETPNRSSVVCELLVSYEAAAPQSRALVPPLPDRRTVPPAPTITMSLGPSAEVVAKSRPSCPSAANT